MRQIDLLRHGETERKGVLLGRTDAVLSELGWQQFEKQTRNREYCIILTSPLKRAREPAEQLANARNVQTRRDKDWAELDFGAWDGKPVAELRKDAEIAQALDAFYRDPNASGPPGGENWMTLSDRIALALGRLLEAPDEGNALIVTHAGPMRAALSLACDIPLDRVWALKIDYGTRITLRFGRVDGKFWGEIIEIVQP